MRQHRRLGDLIGKGLLLDHEVVISVNQTGEDIQLVRMDIGARAWVEVVPPEDAGDIAGIIRAAERFWDLRHMEWRFESVRQGWSSPDRGG